MGRFKRVHCRQRERSHLRMSDNGFARFRSINCDSTVTQSRRQLWSCCLCLVQRTTDDRQGVIQARLSGHISITRDIWTCNSDQRHADMIKHCINQSTTHVSNTNVVPCRSLNSLLSRWRGSQVPQRDIIHDVLAPLHIILQTIEPPPEGIIPQIELYKRTIFRD